MRTRIVVLAAVGLLALAVVLGGGGINGWLRGEGDGAMVVTADFEDTTGLYVGNQVSYLGVEVGEIVAVQRRGTTMRAVLHLDPDVELPADAGAEILQSSLVTDRTIEIGPAYTGGATLADGDHIAVEHTRSPATVDEIATSLDELVLALDSGLGRASGDQDLGRLLESTADTLRGNGDDFGTVLADGQDALEVVNDERADLTAVSTELAAIVDLLAERDGRIRSFTRGARAATSVLADQREEMVLTLDSLDRLTRVATRFLKRNATVLGDDLAGLDDLVALVEEHKESLGEAWDVMPTMAENYARAYDWKLGRLRVQFAFSVGPFSSIFRDHFCQLLVSQVPQGGRACSALFQPDGTGLLDPLLDGIYDGLPGGIP
ncbi:MCE family protein [Nocardioides sp. BGMRC 2183]|nr:MCE family protein [Nocardioides sp. BGMRC 2183]